MGIQAVKPLLMMLQKFFRFPYFIVRSGMRKRLPGLYSYM